VWLTSKRSLDLRERVLLMGVLNVTPDSFSDGNLYFHGERALERAWQLIEDGADIIDAGAESTRPGAAPVTAEIELERLEPLLAHLDSSFPVPFSIDTTKARVAEAALSAGAEIVNDVSGLKKDPLMAEAVARNKAGLVIMHMRGDSLTMQSLVQYDDLTGEVRAELEESARIALEAGIDPRRIVFDPGIGFAKDGVQNCILINRLDQLSILDRPLLVGPSRKSFIGKILGLPVEERLEGTIAASVLAVLKGARILRVHDVKEVKRALEVTTAIMEESYIPA
jgi:dihydropteroate synthase